MFIKSAKMILVMMKPDDEEPDTPPARLGFFAMKSSRTEICGARIMSGDTEYVQLESGEYLCGSCIITSLFASIYRGTTQLLKPIPPKFKKGAAGRMWAL